MISITVTSRTRKSVTTAWLHDCIMDAAQKLIRKKLRVDGNYQSVLNVQKRRGAPYRGVKNDHIRLLYNGSGHWLLCDSFKTSLSRRNSSSAFSLSKNKLMGMFWYAKNARALDQLYGKPISVTIPESLIPFKCIRCSQKYSIRNLQRATSQKNELLQRRFSNLLAAVAKQLFWWTLSVAASLINSLQMLQQIIKNTTFLFCDKFFSL